MSTFDPSEHRLTLPEMQGAPEGWWLQADPAANYRRIIPGSFVPWCIDSHHARRDSPHPYTGRRAVTLSMPSKDMALLPEHALAMARELIFYAGLISQGESR